MIMQLNSSREFPRELRKKQKKKHCLKKKIVRSVKS